MLRAVDSDGKTVLYSDLTPETPKTRDRDYRCPDCGEKVIAVIPRMDSRGRRRITPHFRHKPSKIRCNRSGFSEGETQEHLDLKALVHSYAKNKGFEPELEPQPPIYGHRPDLRIRVLHSDKPEHIFCVEIQCSKIASAEIRERNESYRRAGYTPVWIFGQKYIDRLSTDLPRHAAVRKLFTPAECFSFSFPETWTRPRRLPSTVQCLVNDNERFFYTYKSEPLTLLRLDWSGESDESGWGTLSPMGLPQFMSWLGDGAPMPPKKRAKEKTAAPIQPSPMHSSHLVDNCLARGYYARGRAYERERAYEYRRLRADAARERAYEELLRSWQVRESLPSGWDLPPDYTYICAYCGEYCDDNYHILHGAPGDDPADILLIHDQPIVDSDGIWCPGHKLGLPFEVVVEG